MAEYEERERNYNDNLGQVVGRYATAIVEADSEAKDAHARRVLALAKAPNAEFSAKTSLIGFEEALETKISVPAMAVTDVRPIVVEEATLELDMTVSASQESESRLDSKTSASGSAKVGWGPFSVSMKMSADVSVGKTNKRKSDYRSHTNAKLTMRQGEVPEGLSLIMDSLNQTTAKGLQINQELIGRKAQALGAAAEALPAAEESGGGDAE